MDILNNLSDKEILGLTIIGEARGEPIEGQIAVGCVVRNRLLKHKSFREICLAPKQFSCWNENDSNRAILLELAERMITGQTITDSYYRQCFWVASGIVDWAILDNTKGATNYLTKQLYESDKKPSWATRISNINEYGSQVFFQI